MSIAVASPEKQRVEARVQLPPAVETLRRALDGDGKRRGRANPLDCVKSRAMQRAMEVLCFLRAYSVSGLKRWAIARLSPRHRMTQLATRRRVLRLYRASRQREAMTRLGERPGRAERGSGGVS